MNLPYSPDAERAVLGSVLLNPEVFEEVYNAFGNQPRMFYDEKHVALYKAMLRLKRASKPIDTMTILESLAHDGGIDSCGGASYLSELAGSVPTSANAARYAEVVHRYAMARISMARLDSVRARILNEPMDVETLRSELESVAVGIEPPASQFAVTSIAEFIDESAEQLINSMEREGVNGLKLGYTDFDDLTGGLVPCDVCVVAARTSVGKTAFALCSAVQVAMAGTGVLMFSCEMDKVRIGKRLLMNRAGLTRKHLAAAKAGGWQTQRAATLQQTARAVSGLPIWVDDTPKLTPEQILLRTERLMRKHEIGLVIIDYLQYLRTEEKAENRRVAVGMISKGISAAAKTLRVPIMLLSQLSRKAANERPTMVDLKESGEIEEDADIVMLLSKSEELKNGVLFDVCKNRDGSVGEFTLIFEREFQRFNNIERWPHGAQVQDEIDELIKG